MIKILFDLTFVRSASLFSGVAKYGYRILEYIVVSKRQSNYVLLLNEQTADSIVDMFPQFECIIIKTKWIEKLPFKSLFYSIFFKYKVNKIDADLLFCPYGNPINCLKTRHKKVSVIHDLQVRIDVNAHTKKEIIIYTFAENKIMENSEYVLTISDFSRNQILSFYPGKDNKVLNMGSSVSMVKGKNLLPMRVDYDYLLYVGRLCDQKNVLTLVKAFCLIKEQYPNLNLVLLAKNGKYWEETIKPFALEHGILDRIILTGQCTEENLSQWYLGAKCFVFPSIREGFGFPPIEAAFMKIPVVSSKSDSLEEVTLGLLNYYDPPLDEKELSRVIKNVLDNSPSERELDYIRAEYEKKYSINVFGNRICDFIEKNANYK